MTIIHYSDFGLPYLPYETEKGSFVTKYEEGFKSFFFAYSGEDTFMTYLKTLAGIEKVTFDYLEFCKYWWKKFKGYAPVSVCTFTEFMDFLNTVKWTGLN